MTIRAMSLGLAMVLASFPTLAQRMSDARLGGTTSSDANSRASDSLDAKNNPELHALSRKVGESVARLNSDYHASQKLVPSLTLNEFSQMKLASKEFKLKYADIVDARRSTIESENAQGLTREAALEKALGQLRPKIDRKELQQKMVNIRHTANTLAPPN